MRCLPAVGAQSELACAVGEMGLGPVMSAGEWGVVEIAGLARWAVLVVGRDVVVVETAGAGGGVGEDVAAGAQVGALLAGRGVLVGIDGGAGVEVDDRVQVDGAVAQQGGDLLEQHRPEVLDPGDAVAAVGDRAAVIAGTTNYNTSESIELTMEADALGVDAFLLTVPYYNNPPQEGLYQHFKAIAMHTKKPCILYNVPSRTVRNMDAATTVRLSEIDNIVGIKEASGNLEQIAKIIEGAGPDFRVWSGNDSETLPILSIGGYGIVSVVSHLAGLQVQDMIHRFLGGDRSEEHTSELQSH